MEKMKAEKWQPQDVADELADEPELLRYMNLLPKGLWSRHFEKLEKIRDEKPLDDDKTPVSERRINYLLGILQAREDATEEFSANDDYFKNNVLTNENSKEFGNSLRSLLVTNGNFLGSGQTARVKSMPMPELNKTIAIKYLLTPTSKTLSVNSEHDMLHEVNTELEIEAVRQKQGLKDSIRVPQPLFFYKRGKLQCYGMEEINGMTLFELLESKEYKKGRDEIFSVVQEKFSSPEARNELHAQVDAFMNAVHEICLHGDIKLGNVMINNTGQLYLIDFGQSLHVRNMEEKTRDQFENIMAHEREQMRICLQRLFNEIQQRPIEKVAA